MVQLDFLRDSFTDVQFGSVWFRSDKTTAAFFWAAAKKTTPWIQATFLKLIRYSISCPLLMSAIRLVMRITMNCACHALHQIA